MSPSQSTNSRQVCEKILQSNRSSNVERGILRSEVAVTDRLLAHGLSLEDAYRELFQKLHDHHSALEAFLGLLLSTAAFWSPEKMAETRAEREQLTKINAQVAKKAGELASLLQQRMNLNNTSDFTCETHYHIIDVIKAAAAGNHLFRSYVEAELESCRTRFDLKYWPPLSDIVQELADDAAAAFPTASNPLTAAGTEATRASLADFLKVFLAAIDEHDAGNHGRLPRGFSVTDNTLASLVNCALDLGSDDMVDGQYVKRFRQREREPVR